MSNHTDLPTNAQSSTSPSEVELVARALIEAQNMLGGVNDAA